MNKNEKQTAMYKLNEIIYIYINYKRVCNNRATIARYRFYDMHAVYDRHL